MGAKNFSSEYASQDQIWTLLLRCVADPTLRTCIQIAHLFAMKGRALSNQFLSFSPVQPFVIERFSLVEFMTTCHGIGSFLCVMNCCLRKCNNIDGKLVSPSQQTFREFQRVGRG